MKTINETFEDSEYKKLVDQKGNESWHDFILKLSGGALNGKTNKVK